jgi:hypothetical protein
MILNQKAKGKRLLGGGRSRLEPNPEVYNKTYFNL